MRAVLVERFGAAPRLTELPDPAPGPDDALVRVEATGLCRSDWHAWAGHDGDVRPPYVPGHEFVGIVEAVGSAVRTVRVGDRVTSPFVCGCGRCADCLAGRAQVCADQQQPGFTYDGSFAELVLIRGADTNAVLVPDDVDPLGAALLGCRFATSFRAVADVAAVRPGEVLLVLGSGGVGLSAVMIGAALGARVLAVDVAPAALERARAAGAEWTLDVAGLDAGDAVAAVRSTAVPVAAIEALGSAGTLALGIRSLASGGRLVQVGLLPDDPVVPMGEVIARELTVRGSHGMAAADYPRMLALIRSGALRPEALVADRIPLDEAPAALAGFGDRRGAGVTMIVAGEPLPAPD